MAGIVPHEAGGWVNAALAVGVGKSLQEASALSGCAERTIRRWLAGSQTFQAKVEEVRRLLVSQAVGQLADAATEAIQTLRGNLKAEGEYVQNQAASRLLELLLRFRHQETMAQKLATLEELVERLKEEHPEWFKLDQDLDGDAEPR